MRITMKTIYSQINTDLNRLTEKMAKTNSSISSGKIYRRPSDAPVALTHALSLRASIKDSDQFQDNIVYAKGWVRATESAISQIQDRLLRAKGLAVQGANDSQDAHSRRAIAAEIKAIREEVVALGNTKLGDRYVLGGTRTRGYPPGQAPFVLNQDGIVTYNGNREALSVDVASGVTQRINLDGHEALVQSDLFNALDLLYDSLTANSQPDIEVALADVDRSINYLSGKVAVLGATENSLDNMADMAATLSLTNTERLSDTEDTDMIKAVSDLRTQETSYQAALSAAAKVMSMSLVDFI